MASDSVHCKPPGGKVCVRNNGLVPIVAVHKKRESLLLAETLRPADSSEEGQIQLLPVPLHSRAKEDDVALGQLTTWAERAGFLPRTSWHRKPRVSVPKTSIGKSELGDGVQVWMLEHVLLPREPCQRFNIWQGKARNCMVCD